jgi:hypothetical protein
MAEGRMLKKKISVNEALADLSSHASRIAFTWAIPHLDVDGFITGSPRTFKALVIPLLEDIKPPQVEKFFEEWEIAGLVVRHESSKGPCLQFPAFQENQKGIRPEREAKSIYSGSLQDNSGRTPGVVQDNSGRTQAQIKVKESKLKESNAQPPKSAGAKIVFESSHFLIDEDWHKQLQSDYPGLHPPLLLKEIKKAADWLTDNPRRHKRKSNGKMANPKVFLRNWLDKVQVPAEMQSMAKPPVLKADPNCPTCQGIGIEYLENNTARPCGCRKEIT